MTFTNMASDDSGSYKINNPGSALLRIYSEEAELRVEARWLIEEENLELHKGVHDCIGEPMSMTNGDFAEWYAAKEKKFDMYIHDYHRPSQMRHIKVMKRDELYEAQWKMYEMHEDSCDKGSAPRCGVLKEEEVMDERASPEWDMYKDFPTLPTTSHGKEESRVEAEKPSFASILSGMDSRTGVPPAVAMTREDKSRNSSPSCVSERGFANRCNRTIEV